MTSKITKAVSMALVAVAAVGASAGAFAATNPTQGPTDLFVAVWNTTTGTSYVEDLGSIGAGTFSQLSTTFDTAGYSTSWNVDGGNLATTLGSGSYNYQVFAASLGTAAFKGDSGYLSLAAPNSVPTTMNNTQLVNNSIGAAGSITAYLAANLPGTTSAVTGTIAGGNSWVQSNAGGSPGFDFQNNALLGISAATVGSGNALNLVDYVSINNQTQGLVTTTNVGANGGLGAFVLSASGLLTYNAGGASPVPLPPAGWLLISGLLGLLAVSRRRGAEAS